MKRKEKELLVEKIVGRITKLYREDSHMARKVAKGLMKLSNDELQGLDLMILTSKEVE